MDAFLQNILKSIAYIHCQHDLPQRGSNPDPGVHCKCALTVGLHRTFQINVIHFVIHFCKTKNG